MTLRPMTLRPMTPETASERVDALGDEIRQATASISDLSDRVAELYLAVCQELHDLKRSSTPLCCRFCGAAHRQSDEPCPFCLFVEEINVALIDDLCEVLEKHGVE